MAETKALTGKRVLLIITGGIAAYKALALIRRLRERGVAVRPILTRAAHEFVTPLSVGALAESSVYSDLFDLTQEREIGHIRLARDTDLVVVAPASADFIAKLAQGRADDLASAACLATGAPILLAPAMNPFMWENAATRRNLAQVLADGARTIGPEHGEMAERNEAGPGRMSEPEAIAARVFDLLTGGESPLAGRHVLITAGPTHEPIDPVRYIANRSSGRQGYALAEAARDAGAMVTLVSGPVALAPPEGVTLVPVESARDMLAAVEKALPAEIAIMAAAVADWHVATQGAEKIKKQPGAAPPPLHLAENPDILATLSALDAPARPGLVVGFAAETEHVVAHAKAKRLRKGCDWIIANDVSPGTGVMGGARNQVHLISAAGVEDWPDLPKGAVATRLIARIAAHLAGESTTPEADA